MGILTPLCPRLDLPLLSNLLGTADKRGNSPAIDYLLDTLAGMSDNDRLADVLLCYATLDGFKEAVLCRYLDMSGQPDYATAVASAFMRWNTEPGRWQATAGKLELSESATALSRKRAVLACFPDVLRDGRPPLFFLPPI